jgi:hypothetical protein
MDGGKNDGRVIMYIDAALIAVVTFSTTTGMLKLVWCEVTNVGTYASDMFSLYFHENCWT